MDEVIDSVALGTDDLGSEVELEVEQPETEVEAPEAGQETAQADDDPYSSKTSKEYSAWLKGIRDANPETNGKFARMAKDDHARLFQLNQMEPRGIDGIREKYAMLDSVIHNSPDGTELRGVEALGAIQDELRNVGEVDELLAAGDPKALDALGEEFNEGLARLTPTILDRIQQSNPEAYANAVLPHFVAALAKSDLVTSFNGLVDVLNEQAPAWLPEDKKGAWQADKMQRIFGLAGNMGNWLNAQAKKVGELPAKGATNGNGRANPASDVGEREKAFEAKVQTAHWNDNISPKMDEHAATKFNEEFRSFAKRLRLDAAATNNLKLEFSKRVASKAAANPAYISQIGRYRGQKNPDPNTVINFAKVEFNKHARSVMEQLVNERYGGFLKGKPAAKAAPAATNGSKAAVSPGVTIVGAKPANIDFQRTPVDWIHQKKYMTTDGKIVQVRA